MRWSLSRLPWPPAIRAAGFVEACGNSSRAGSGYALACAVCALGLGASGSPSYFAYFAALLVAL
eukprot:11677919-Alexandrium_andersonii.AAC.1